MPNLGLHVLKYPTGRFGFVGRVPQVLAHKGSPEDLKTARICGPGLAKKIAEREGREFETLSWATADEAIAFAREHGFNVDGER